MTDAAAIVPADSSTYVPGPVEVGWQIWFAAFISTIPFVIGAYEFGKRIVSFTDHETTTVAAAVTDSDRGPVSHP